MCTSNYSTLSQDSEVNRSTKATAFPDGDFEDHPASGGGSRGIKGWTGDGKGAKSPEEWMPKKRENA